MDEVDPGLGGRLAGLDVVAALANPEFLGQVKRFPGLHPLTIAILKIYLHPKPVILTSIVRS